jgi:hypothetical protein
MGETTVKVKDQYAQASQQMAAPFMAPEEFVNTFSQVLSKVAPELAGIAVIYIIMNLFIGRKRKDDALDKLVDAIAERVAEKLKAGRSAT